MNHTVECRVTPMVFETLRQKYGLEEGETHLHFGIPRAVFQFGTDAKEEFLRGIADTIADFDKAWGEEKAWRVQWCTTVRIGIVVGPVGVSWLLRPF